VLIRSRCDLFTVINTIPKPCWPKALGQITIREPHAALYGLVSLFTDRDKLDPVLAVSFVIKALDDPTIRLLSQNIEVRLHNVDVKDKNWPASKALVHAPYGVFV
jgi:hypothetical protein